MVAAAEKVFAVKGKKYCVNSYTIFCRCFLYGVVFVHHRQYLYSFRVSVFSQKRERYMWLYEI